MPTNIDPLRVLHERPAECAYETLDRRQRIMLPVLLCVLIVALCLAPVISLIVLNAIFTLFYICQTFFKLAVVARSLRAPAEIPVSLAELHEIPDEQLPTYTILIPLFREASVLDRLFSALRSLDYPISRLQVFLLLEEEDTETISGMQKMHIPAHFRKIIVPSSYPTTKPKACNWGLELAETELLVIFDAEDIPEPDQLRKAAAAFCKSAPNVVCLQARLNYFNPRQNILTRWFTAEYSAWFDLFLPGLTSLKAPVPLGGTSNHFRVSALRELGGWDPFNVTEDCDLGVRLHRHGYRTSMIDSTTWEEANANFWSWIRQRSRWVKGYLQTWFVHMRQPVGLIRQLGFEGWFSFQMTVGGSLVSFLLNPFYWLLTIAWLFTHSEFIITLFPTPIYIAGVFCLTIGNLSFIAINVIACLRRGQKDLAAWALLSPLYWVMMSIAAWKAAFQLVINPHYWEKTEHGLTQENIEPEEIDDATK